MGGTEAAAQRRRLTWGVACLLWVGVWTMGARAETGPAPAEPDLVLCLKAAKPPKIDGALDDECWARSGRLSNFVAEESSAVGSETTQIASPAKTTAWIAYDKANLYVALLCEGPQAGPAAANVGGRGLTSDDKVHLLVARLDSDVPPFDPPKPGRTQGGEPVEPLHLVVDASGTIQKLSGAEGALLDYPRGKAAVAKSDDGLRFELAIPFAGKPARAGEVWRINLGRTSPWQEAAGSLACTYGGLEDVVSFPQMEFVEEGVMLRDLDLGDERGDWGGAARAGARVRNSSKARAEVTLKAVTEPGGEVVSLTRFSLAPEEERNLEWEYQVEEAFGNRMRVLLGPESGPAWWAFERPLKDRYLLPRLRKTERALDENAGYLSQEIVFLGEFKVFTGQLKRLGEQAAELERQVAAAEGDRSGCEGSLKQLEDATARVGVLVGILQSYSLTEKTAGAMGRKFAFFSLAPFEMATYLTMPGPEQVLREVKATACPGEYKAVTFRVATAEPLRNVSLDVTDLTGEKGEITKESEELWVVKCWYQGGGTEEKVLVPELLAKDDREPLAGDRAALRLKGEVVTDMPAGVSKQFWLTIRVPEEAEPGSYRGKVVLRQAERKDYELPIEVEVLPFRLVEPRQRFAVNYRGTLGGEGRLTLAAYQRQLRDIHEHGFGQAAIADGADFLAQALTLRMVEGLSEGAVWMEPSAEGQLPPAVGKVMGPPLAVLVETGEGLDARAAAVHSLGGQTYAAVDHPLSPDEAVALDFGEFSADSPLFARHLRGEEEGISEPSPAMEYYSWDAWREDGLKNRLLCGLYLWKWRLGGAMARVYQETTSDPYVEATSGGIQRRQMLTYPSLRGPVSTVQWEACREGIYDLRYVATLEFWLDRARREVNRLIEMEQDGASPRAEALMKAYADGRGTLDKARESIYVHPSQTLRCWSAASLQSFRDEVTDRTVELQRLLEGAGQ